MCSSLCRAVAPVPCVANHCGLERRFELSAEVTFPVNANVSAMVMTVGAMFTALVLPPLTDVLQHQPHGIMWSIALVAASTLVRAPLTCAQASCVGGTGDDCRSACMQISLAVFLLGVPHYELRRTKLEALEATGKGTSDFSVELVDRV